MLDGRRATTHWRFVRAFQTMYPKVKLEDDRIYIVDGPIWTSAGMAASLDLALVMVEKDLGADAARSAAKKMVLFHRRAGGQSQFSALLDLDPKSDRIQSALTYARRNPRTLRSVEQLAEAANLSPRQFSRAFRAETGQSPARAIENLRLEAARLMMEAGRHPIQVVTRDRFFKSRTVESLDIELVTKAVARLVQSTQHLELVGRHVVIAIEVRIGADAHVLDANHLHHKCGVRSCVRMVSRRRRCEGK